MCLTKRPCITDSRRARFENTMFVVMKWYSATFGGRTQKHILLREQESPRGPSSRTDAPPRHCSLFPRYLPPASVNSTSTERIFQRRVPGRSTSSPVSSPSPLPLSLLLQSIIVFYCLFVCLFQKPKSNFSSLPNVYYLKPSPS